MAFGGTCSEGDCTPVEFLLRFQFFCVVVKDVKRADKNRLDRFEKSSVVDIFENDFGGDAVKISDGESNARLHLVPDAMSL